MVETVRVYVWKGIAGGLKLLDVTLLGFTVLMILYHPLFYSEHKNNKATMVCIGRAITVVVFQFAFEIKLKGV